MPKYSVDAAIGFIVLAVAAGFLLFLYNGRDAADHGHYEVYAEFISANGISVGADVRIAGVNVGEVTSMTLDTNSFQAKVHFTIREDIEVPEDSVISVSLDGLLGDRFLEILPGGSFENIAAGNGFLNTQDSVDVMSVLAGFASGFN